MAAISHADTIRRAAQVLGRDEELLWDLSGRLEPEDGILWILDIDDGQLLAVANAGIEALREIIDDQIDRKDWPPLARKPHSPRSSPACCYP